MYYYYYNLICIERIRNHITIIIIRDKLIIMCITRLPYYFKILSEIRIITVQNYTLGNRNFIDLCFVCIEQRTYEYFSFLSFLKHL